MLTETYKIGTRYVRSSKKHPPLIKKALGDLAQPPSQLPCEISVLTRIAYQ